MLCGLATSVKWSGLYVLAALGLFIAVDEMLARRAFTRRWILAGAWGEGIPVLALAAAVFFLPLWNGSIISYSYWHLHMWFPSWI